MKTERKLVFDVNELPTSDCGKRVLNCLTSSGATLFTTARGRKAVRIRETVWNKIRPTLKVNVGYGEDDIQSLVATA